jgi:small-conductance mechanosensitive channel
VHLRKGAESKRAGWISGVVALLEGAIIVGTGVFILYAWNIDPFATDLTGAHRILPGLVSAAIVVTIGLSLWRMANALLSEGKEASAEDGPPEDEGGAGGSRIETVMPVIRAVAAAFIGTVTVLLALSSLGVQIAPLLAGAGILGLAIGFGAQKVVEDVISGVLYLIEDAFRKGEYIETSQGKGVVEAIMLRSVRLRHHLGPVFTIPYSAMGTIQNHSRDWVTMKLKFEVSPNQDLEKVRKLVKKVGQQLLEDPEIEGQFLAPLKSQGAVALVGSNYQIGVKFTSEPGKQFLIRRKALNAIQKAFAENGIEMAAPRVIVDAQEPDQVAAAAAKALTDQQQAAAGGAPAADQR